MSSKKTNFIRDIQGHTAHKHDQHTFLLKQTFDNLIFLIKNIWMEMLHFKQLKNNTNVEQK